jgi:hypothetical protein
MAVPVSFPSIYLLAIPLLTQLFPSRPMTKPSLHDSTVHLPALQATLRAFGMRVQSCLCGAEREGCEQSEGGEGLVSQIFVLLIREAGREEPSRKERERETATHPFPRLEQPPQLPNSSFVSRHSNPALNQSFNVTSSPSFTAANASPGLVRGHATALSGQRKAE